MLTEVSGDSGQYKLEPLRPSGEKGVYTFGIHQKAECAIKDDSLDSVSVTGRVFLTNQFWAFPIPERESSFEPFLPSLKAEIKRSATEAYHSFLAKIKRSCLLPGPFFFKTLLFQKAF